MPIRLVALDEGPDITIDRAMLIVGRHPQCDARLDSIRVSRRHCCMMQDKENGDIIIRDLGSTNGIRINGQRVEMGKLRSGDELSIAHIRFRLEAGHDEDLTLAETMPANQASGVASGAPSAEPAPPSGLGTAPPGPSESGRVSNWPPVSAPAVENPLAAAVREMLPAAMAERCRIQVIVQVPPNAENVSAPVEPYDEVQTPESDHPCPPDSSL